MLAFSAVHQGDALKRQSWTKWLPALRPYRDCVGVRLVCSCVRESNGACVRARQRSVIHIQISAAASNAFVKRWRGHNVLLNSGEERRRRVTRSCTFTRDGAGDGVCLWMCMYRRVWQKESMRVNVRYLGYLLLIECIIVSPTLSLPTTVISIQRSH